MMNRAGVPAPIGSRVAPQGVVFNSPVIRLGKGKQMKAWLATLSFTLACAVIGLIIVDIGNATAIDHLNGKVNYLTSRQDGLYSGIRGEHRDLITCGDWSSMWIEVTGTDAYGNGLDLSGKPVLPSHCINR